MKHSITGGRLSLSTIHQAESDYGDYDSSCKNRTSSFKRSAYTYKYKSKWEDAKHKELLKYREQFLKQCNDKAKKDWKKKRSLSVYA